MYLTLLDMDEFVRLNDLKEVSDPIYMTNGRPTPEGLFSYEIFGISQFDRQTIWAYIDLGARFLHPLAVINFIRYGAIYENIIYGLKNYRFEDGVFIEDPDGDTGIDFLYEHYDEIKWRTTKSVSSNERIDFLRKTPKNRIFMTKFPVIPPFYRDVNENSSLGIPKVNNMYKKILSQSIALKQRGAFSFFGNLTKANIERAMVEIYNFYVLDQVHGKNGILRKSVMGRSIDYGAWLVMSAPKIDGERYTDMPVDFDHAAYPLAAICSMAKPFLIKAMRDWFDEEFIRGGKYPYGGNRNDESKTIMLDLIDPSSEFSEEVLDAQLTNFIKGYSTRFEPIPLPRNEQGIEGYIYITGRFGVSKEISSRPATWTDIIYICAEKALANKYVMTSRYPVLDYYGIFYAKPRIMTTNKTTNAYIDGVEYKFYPIVEVGKDSSNSFVNTMSPSNVFLKGLEGDFDGDSVPNRLLFTDEANADAARYQRDKKNFLDLNGRNIRKTERDFIQGLYSLSKPPTQIKLENLN